MKGLTMTNKTYSTAYFVSLFSFLILSISLKAQTAGSYIANEIIVKYSTDAGVNSAATQSLRMAFDVDNRKYFPSINAELWEIDSTQITSILDQLNSNPNIEYAEPNYILSLHKPFASAIPNVTDDPSIENLWGLNNEGQTGGSIDADIDGFEAWNVSTGSKDVIIGVIDSGVDWMHDELEDNMWVNEGEIPDNNIDDDGNGYIDDIYGYNFAYGNGNVYDDNGHGTHVSGTIAAVGNNGIGIAGVTWNARIMALKFLDAGGFGTTDAAIAAIEYATSMGAHITNNSWGGGAFSQALKDAIEAAGDAGHIFVASAGNSSVDIDVYNTYPAGYDSENIISVASSNHNDGLSWFSNYGKIGVDVAAPGSSIYSTLPGNTYAYYDGTSMAAPHVSGVAALILSVSPDLINDGSPLVHEVVKERIMNTADELDEFLNITSSGARLNAFMAIAEPDSTPPSPVSDLVVATSASNGVYLEWTATGDDADLGTASSYEIRYSTSAITEDNFDLASLFSHSLIPDSSGTSQSLYVDGLDFSTLYHFALKAADEWGNKSIISNVANGTTLGIPEITVSPDSLFDALLTGQTSTQTVTISNTGEGTLDFEIENVKQVFGGLSSALTKTQNPLNSNQSTSNEMVLATYNPLIVGDEEVLVIQETSAWGLFLESFIEDNFGINATTIYSSDIPSVNFNNYDLVLTAGDQSSSYYSNISSHVAVFEEYLANGGAVLYQLATQGDNVSIAGGVNVLYGNNENYNTILEPEHPIVLELDSPVEGNWANHTYIANLPGDATLITETTSSGSTTTAEYRFGAGTVVVTGMTWEYLYYYGFEAGAMQFNAIKYMLEEAGFSRYLSATPISGTVNSGESLDIDIIFDASGLGTDSFLQSFYITSNDVVTPEYRVATQLDVTGVQDILIEEDTLFFPTIFVDTQDTLFLLIENDGTESLAVQTITSGNGAFGINFEETTIPAGDEIHVPVSFSPTEAINYFTTFTISSDDPDEPVVSAYGSGSAILPPVIGVTPDSLYSDLLTGQVEVHTLTIDNTEGNSDLIVSLSASINSEIDTANALAAPPLASKSVPVSDNRNHYELLKNERGPTPEFMEFESNQIIADALGGVLYVVDNDYNQVRQLDPTNGEVLNSFSLPENASGPIGLAYDGEYLYYINSFGSLNYYKIDTTTGEVVDTIYLNGVYDVDGLGHDGEYLYALSYGYQTIYVIDFDSETIVESFSLPNIGAGMSFGGDRNTMFLGDFNGFIHEVDPETKEILNTISTPNGGAAYALGYSKALGLLFVNTAGYTVYAINPDNGSLVYSFDSPYSFALATDEASGLNWLEISETGKVIPAGESADFDITFNAEELFGGRYSGELFVESNDPVTPLVNIPLVMDVTGVQDISLSSDSIHFESIFVGDTISAYVEIQNLGTDDLDITDISSSSSHFETDISSILLSPKDSYSLRISFVPTLAQEFTETISITSNDPDENLVQIKLSGTALAPPAMNVSPTDLSSFLIEGQTELQAFTIDNLDGESDLVFDLSIRTINGIQANKATNGAENPLVLSGNSSGNSTSLESGSNEVVPVTYNPLIVGDEEVLVIQETSAWNLFLESFIEDNFGINATTIYSSDIPSVNFNNYDLVLTAGDQSSSYYSNISSHVAVFEEYLANGGAVLYQLATQGDNVSIAGGVDVLYGNYENYNTILEPEHPIVLELDSPVEGNWANHNYIENLPGNAILITETVSSGSTTTAEYRFGAGTVVVTGMTWEYLYYNGFEAGAMQFNAIKYMLEEAGFSRYLTVNPLFGTLSPGESVEIEVLFEATDISPGKYQAEIIVESNDPAGKEVPVAVSLRVYEQGSVEIELLENWNLISSNVQPEFSETGTVLADIADNVTVMLGFDGTGLTFDPLLDSDFNTLTDVYATKGYWLRMAEPDQLTVNGYIQTPDTPLILEEGFNLVSYLPTGPDSLTNALSSVIDNVEIVLGFEGAGLAFSTSIPNEFNTLQYLKPNLGYWIKMTAKDTLFYPNGPAVPADSIAKTSIQNIAYKSSGLVSPSREWISLWGDEVMMDSKLIPKGTVVQAIDPEGNIAGEQVFMKDGKLPLMAIYKDDPTTETDEGFEPGEPITLRFGETEFENLLDWRNNGNIQNLTKVATNLETPSVLPTEFGLDQNYPNPFNPSTIINYALPVSAEVTLEVYNMLGQKVSTILNNEPQEAAFHSVRFDASHLASGVYIYRIKAGSFVQTKKMMLIK